MYLAMNMRTREARAVKVLAKRGTSSPSVYARFQREIEIIRGLSHPNIIKILASGALDDCYYYMMEYMSGGSLAQRFSGGKMALAEIIPIFSCVCKAMSYAHERGIVHRDLKPANILLTEAGSPVVSDFGIAKALDGDGDGLTRSNEIIGTIAYLAPEQRFNTKRVDRRADVYALGAILYEAIMGFPPLGKFPWPHEIKPGFPAAVEKILEQCLSINPEERSPHAGAVLASIDNYQQAVSATYPLMKGDTNSGGHESAAIESHPAGNDGLEEWFRILRTGTTRERLALVREMSKRIDRHQAEALVERFPAEDEKVRWGLIQVLGDLRINAAAPIIMNELGNPSHRECAIEALGKIGSRDAFEPIRQFVIENPSSAMLALVPLARTGKERAVEYLRKYLDSDLAVLRQAAVKGLGEIETEGSLQVLREHLDREQDRRVRAQVQMALKSVDSAIKAMKADQTVQLMMRT